MMNWGQRFSKNTEHEMLNILISLRQKKCTENSKCCFIYVYH